jgi:hypothetical protein
MGGSVEEPDSDGLSDGDSLGEGLGLGLEDGDSLGDSLGLSLGPSDWLALDDVGSSVCEELDDPLADDELESDVLLDGPVEVEVSLAEVEVSEVDALVELDSEAEDDEDDAGGDDEDEDEVLVGAWLVEDEDDEEPGDEVGPVLDELDGGGRAGGAYSGGGGPTSSGVGDGACVRGGRGAPGGTTRMATVAASDSPAGLNRAVNEPCFE